MWTICQQTLLWKVAGYVLLPNLTEDPFMCKTDAMGVGSASLWEVHCQSCQTWWVGSENMLQYQHCVDEKHQLSQVKVIWLKINTWGWNTGETQRQQLQGTSGKLLATEVYVLSCDLFFLKMWVYHRPIIPLIKAFLLWLSCNWQPRRKRLIIQTSPCWTLKAKLKQSFV